MRLANFIEQQMPAILQEWDLFAATLKPAAEGMDAAGLRDHAEQMLQAIALDLPPRVRIVVAPIEPRTRGR